VPTVATAGPNRLDAASTTTAHQRSDIRYATIRAVQSNGLVLVTERIGLRYIVPRQNTASVTLIGTSWDVMVRFGRSGVWAWERKRHLVMEW